MVDVNRLLPLIRLGVFGSVCTASLIVASLCTSILANYADTYPIGRIAFALSTGILTLISVPSTYAISVEYRKAFVSSVAAEVGWCSILGVSWIATAGNVLVVFQEAFWRSYSYQPLSTRWVGLCYEPAYCRIASVVIIVLSFMNAIIFLVYIITVLVFVLILHAYGHTNVWTSQLRSFDWNAGPVAHEAHATQHMDHSGGEAAEDSEKVDGTLDRDRSIVDTYLEQDGSDLSPPLQDGVHRQKSDNSIEFPDNVSPPDGNATLQTTA